MVVEKKDSIEMLDFLCHATKNIRVIDVLFSLHSNQGCTNMYENKTRKSESFKLILDSTAIISIIFNFNISMGSRHFMKSRN